MKDDRSHDDRKGDLGSTESHTPIYELWRVSHEAAFNCFRMQLGAKRHNLQCDPIPAEPSPQSTAIRSEQKQTHSKHMVHWQTMKHFIRIQKKQNTIIQTGSGNTLVNNPNQTLHTKPKHAITKLIPAFTCRQKQLSLLCSNIDYNILTYRIILYY